MAYYKHILWGNFPLLQAYLQIMVDQEVLLKHVCSHIRTVSLSTQLFSPKWMFNKLQNNHYEDKDRRKWHATKNNYWKERDDDANRTKEDKSFTSLW